MKVLICNEVHQRLIEGLSLLGYQVDYLPEISLEETIDIIAGYEGVVINTKIKANKLFIEAGKKLKFIARLGSGLDIIDLKAARKHNIAVLNSPEGNKNAVGEQAVGMLLALMNNLIKADSQVRNAIWNREENRGSEISGKKICIVGFGHTGSSFAKKLSGFDMKISAYDKYRSDIEDHFPTVKQISFEEVFDADIISFHLPLTQETSHMVNDQFLSRCKTGVILINTSRGKVIDTNALVKALDDGKVSGACLDVFENEKPLTYSKKEKNLYKKLSGFSNTVFTPHVAGWTHESKKKIAKVLLKKISKV
jgi:D-3-phosphoglycerate dehydrogenase